VARRASIRTVHWAANDSSAARAADSASAEPRRSLPRGVPDGTLDTVVAVELMDSEETNEAPRTTRVLPRRAYRCASSPSRATSVSSVYRPRSASQHHACSLGFGTPSAASGAGFGRYHVVNGIASTTCTMSGLRSTGRFARARVMSSALSFAPCHVVTAATATSLNAEVGTP